MATQIALFNDPGGPARPKAPTGLARDIAAPLWTAYKSRLIAEYIHQFLIVTKHGVYLDLFAGPQHDTDHENWSVRRVLERRTEGGPAIRHYAVCDKDPAKTQRLLELGKTAKSSFRVYEGDANEHVHQMLADAPITPTTACFCLLDQRTIECHWATVEAVAKHKSENYKIEIFYFLAQGWLDRTMANTRDTAKLEAWWGNAGYEHFQRLQSFERAMALCDRFRNELGYQYAEPFAIHEKGDTSRTMYYMIHASDHRAACKLMATAYELARPEDDIPAPKFRW